MKIDSVDYSRQGEECSVSITGEFFGCEGTFTKGSSGRNSALAALKTMIENEYGAVRIIRHESHSDTSGINAQSVSRIILEDFEGNRSEGFGKNHDIEISALYAL